MFRINFYSFLFIFVLILIVITTVNGRIAYVDPSRNYYPDYFNKNVEQASRDLDMNFFAGDPSEIEEREFAYPSKKVHISPEQPIVDVTREMDHPVYYKLSEVFPPRKIIHSDASKWQRSPKFMHFNNPKGEIILELRVSANNNNDYYNPY